MQKTVATAELPQQFVMFAIPSLTKYVAVEFHGSMAQTNRLLDGKKISNAERFMLGDQFIAHARNRLVMDFLTVYPFATDLFFIDDDTGWPPEKVLEFLDRPEAVVAGVCPKKTDDPQWPCKLELADGKFLQNADGLYSAITVGCAFMRIKRWFIEELVKGRRLYEDHLGDGTTQATYNLFESGLLPHWAEWSGEDFDFCDKVRAYGEKVWVDADIDFSHRGGPKCWKGNLAAYMKANEEMIGRNAAEAWAQTEAAKEAA